ncbi:hypothetical protein PENTCL1PPCAC_5062, partial [Pristionchus entomophagus]
QVALEWAHPLISLNRVTRRGGWRLAHPPYSADGSGRRSIGRLPYSSRGRIRYGDRWTMRRMRRRQLVYEVSPRSTVCHAAAPTANSMELDTVPAADAAYRRGLIGYDRG